MELYTKAQKGYYIEIGLLGVGMVKETRIKIRIRIMGKSQFTNNLFLVVKKCDRLQLEWNWFLGMPEAIEGLQKVFIPKHNTPLLLDYSVPAPEGWWDHWPSLSWEEARGMRSGVDPVKMLGWARKAGHPDLGTVMEIVRDLRQGCDLGTRGEYLCPSVSTNAPSAYEYGDRVTDAIVDGVKKGIIMGPMKVEEIPFKEEGIKINGIMVRLKPNGVARIILNMSKGEPFCVNKGMESEERFEVKMSSTGKWLAALQSAGRGSFFCKLDWEAAYKQLRVQEADVRQQFFCWGGRLFAELCLVFGGSSSVGLYDRLAKVFMFVAIVLSKMPENQVAQIIDDVVACGTEEEVVRFYSIYREVAEDCGVRLASEEDPKKAFAARQEGEVFGVEYCTKSWTWWLREDKLSIMLKMLRCMEEEKIHKLGFIKSIAGKLVHYRLMVPQGKFHLGQIIRMGRSSPKENMERMVELSDWAREEANFWRLRLGFCSRRTLLPDPSYRLPPWTLTVDTDAAGGSTKNWGYGSGAVLGDWWAYLPWGEVINSDQLYCDGKRMSCKMLAWELVGPLMVLTAGMELVKNKGLIVMVDNSGSVAIYKKGWCTSCMLCTTLALAISEVAVSINCKLEIRKVTRCSTVGAEAADAVSKGDFLRFRRLKPQSKMNPGKVPRALVDWVNNPREDKGLGARILGEMGVDRNVLGPHSCYR